MLNLLVRYAKDRGLVAEPGFSAKRVRWGISCDRSGHFTGLVEFGEVEDKRNPGELFPTCPDLSQPELIGGGETRCHFLRETAAVVCLHVKDDIEAEAKLKTEKKHAYFRMLFEHASDEVPAMSAYAALLSEEQELSAVRGEMKNRGVKPNDAVTLVCEGIRVLETSDWHDWWRGFREGLGRNSGVQGKQGEAARMRCLVSGAMEDPARTHPTIRGLADVGGQPGTLLVSFDKEAFGSYGLEQSANAAVGAAAAAGYRAALNDLIERTGKRVGSSKVVHWFKEVVEPQDDPLAFLTADPPVVQEANARKLVEDLLTSIRTGKRAELCGNRYYALTLSGSGGRVMVRDWMEGSFEELAESVSRWFVDLAVVQLGGDSLAPDRGILALARSCVRIPAPGEDKKRKVFDLSVRRVADQLLRPALRGGPIPDSVAVQAIARIRAEVCEERKKKSGSEATAHPPERMAVLRAFIVRKFRAKGATGMADQIRPCLDAGVESPAYHCGRLMALLAELQQQALPDVGAGIVQRYYAAASSTPSLVFGRLIRTSQFHLGKLKARSAVEFETRIAEVAERIGNSMPSTLDLDGQSLFALGYYHQMADLRRK